MSQDAKVEATDLAGWLLYEYGKALRKQVPDKAARNRYLTDENIEALRVGSIAAAQRFLNERCPHGTTVSEKLAEVKKIVERLEQREQEM